MKAKDMAENQYFAHTSPTGATPWQWFSKAGYRYSYAGENLAINFTESVDVENAWIASPTHLANLISDKFDETGIATYQGTYQGQPTTFVVQLFGRQPQSPKVVVPVPKAIAATVPEETQTLPPKIAVAPEVKGESLTAKQPPIDPKEPAPVLLVNEPLFAVAQNLNENESVTPTDSEPEVMKYSTLAERLLVNQGRNVQHIYLIFIIIIYLVLMGMILVEFHRQHPKNIALAILLLCFLGILAYLNSSFVLSFV